jgi:hypothetical protein
MLEKSVSPTRGETIQNTVPLNFPRTVELEEETDHKLIFLLNFNSKKFGVIFIGIELEFTSERCFVALEAIFPRLRLFHAFEPRLFSEGQTLHESRVLI